MSSSVAITVASDAGIWKENFKLVLLKIIFLVYPKRKKIGVWHYWREGFNFCSCYRYIFLHKIKFNSVHFLRSMKNNANCLKS